MILQNAVICADSDWWHVYIDLWKGVTMMLKESLQVPGVRCVAVLE